MAWTLKAKREQLPAEYIEYTYSENVRVVNGIATVETSTAKDRLLRTGGYDLIEDTTAISPKDPHQEDQASQSLAGSEQYNPSPAKPKEPAKDSTMAIQDED